MIIYRLITVGAVVLLVPALDAVAAEKELPTWAQGAVLAFSFEEETLTEGRDGSRGVKDLSNSGSSGILHGPESVEGKVGQGLEFQDEDHVGTALGSDPTCSWSLVAWVHPYKLENLDEEVEDVGIGHCIIDSDVPGEGGLGIGVDADEIRMLAPCDNEWITGKAFPAAFKTDAWRHVAVVVDADTEKITAYVDGKQIGIRQMKLNREALIGDHSFDVGFRPDVANLPFHGRMDEVALWNRALTPEEVASLHATSSEGKSYCEVIAEAAKIRIMPQFQGHYYRLFPRKCGWHEAKHFCETLGGRLACVESAEENEFLAHLALGRQVWLGATDEVVEGDWKWVNGQSLKYSNWYPGGSKPEPNNSGGVEHYLKNNFKLHGAWNDGSDDPEHDAALVCEWEIQFGAYLAVSPTATAKFQLSQDGTFSVGARNGTWHFTDGTITLAFTDGRRHKLKMLNSRIFSDSKGLTLVWQTP